MLGDILEKIEWNETDDIRVFFMNIYPFLDVSVRQQNLISLYSFADHLGGRIGYNGH